MMSTKQMELSFNMGKRKYLFCGDSNGAESLYVLVHQAMDEKVPFDFLIIENEAYSFLDLWFSHQKMGTYLYLSGELEFVNILKNLAVNAGFSEHEMQMKVWGTTTKKLICCTCHGGNDVGDKLHITCKHCGQELEVSNHYSRRLDAYLGYVSIK